tara:strand:- start:743 stop:901 length:159 start_codon:yes stop_codon:yes gene_type:complete
LKTFIVVVVTILADDISHIRNRVGVMVNGRWMPSDEIERRLRNIALFYGNEP